MDNLNELKNIWKTTDASTLPSSAQLIASLRNYRRWQIIKGVSVIVMIIMITIVLIWLIFDYQSVMITTRIGEALYFAAIIVLIRMSAGSLRRAASGNLSNSEYLSYLKKEREQQIYFYKRTQVAGFILSAAGLFFYIYEKVHVNYLWMITGYTLLIIILVAMWKLIRPRSMKKRMKHLNEAIERAELLLKQFTNE